MALDDASPQAGDSFAQQNDAPFDNGEHAMDRLEVKREQMVTPDPFVLYFGFGGETNWERNILTALRGRVETTRTHLQRPPTQEEMDAFVSITSRSVYHGRAGAPIGFLAYTARAFSQAKKSPLYYTFVPGAAETVGRGFPSPRQLGEGALRFAKIDPIAFRAVAAQTVFRSIFWTLTGATMTSIYAVFNEARAVLSDPRLTSFVRERTAQNPEDIRKRKVEAATEKYRESQRRKQQQQQQQQQPEQQQPDEMSPEQQDAFAGNNENNQQDGYQSLYTGGSKRAETTTGPNRSHDYPVTMESSRQDQDSGSGFFDDASPTAPEYQSENTTSSLSAWDRIRQQNASVPQGRVSPQPSGGWNAQNNSVSGSSGSSSSGNRNNPDMERQREREQARADFERMLDAERNLSSDDAPTGQSRGWGRN